MVVIPLATVLPGAKGFKEGNVNDTFRGQILLADRTVKGAVLKDLDEKQLANELLAFVLARAAGLPVPDAYLALVRGSDLEVQKAPRINDDRLVFASVDMKIPNITFRASGLDPDGQQQLLQDILKWDHLGRLYAFDTWVANVDRHTGNLLFGGKGEIWLIDHGHCFSGPAWQPCDLNADLEYRNRLSEWLLPLMAVSQKLRMAADIDVISSEINGINVIECSQLSLIERFIPREHAEAAQTFLQARAGKVPKHTRKALEVLI